MTNTTKYLVILLAFLLSTSWSSMAQSTTGSLSGLITDQQQGALPNVTVTTRNVETNVSLTVQTDGEGRYRFGSLPVGAYELTVTASGFAKHVQSGITLALNQPAVVDVTMKAGGVQEVVTVSENASLLNTTTAEVGTRFDSRRISELPITTNRNVYNIALSAAGVTQLGSGQSSFAGGGAGATSGVSYSANGGRVRSNNFMVDGQDNNEFGVAGAAQPLNNPDLIQEVQLITNQLTAEYGRNSSSVFNAITKSGTNEFHGSAFWFHNDNKLNACSNLNKGAGFCREAGTPGFISEGAPFRVENQVGGTLGGPLYLPRFGEGGPAYTNGRDRTFFFFSIQRWWDRQLGSGSTIRGVPTEAGRQILQSAVGNRPQIAALLRFLPAAQTPIGTNATFGANGQTFTVPLGSLTGSTSGTYNDWQVSGRIDHRLSANNILTARYLYQDGDQGGAGQATPPGNASNTVQRAQSMNLSLASVLSPTMVNELRLGYQRLATTTNAQDPSSELIPAIEIFELGVQEFNSSARRTGIGLAANLPQFSYRNSYQLQDNYSITKGSHAMKFGADIQRRQLKQFFFPISRGRLAYNTLQNYVDDLAAVATINRPLPGGIDIFYYDWHDIGFYGQDSWKIRPNFTLTYGLRYETPGQPIRDLVEVNERIVQAAGGNQGFAFTPVPERDKNNFQPRIGFN
ncbi:MAG: TonB-dependent receptor, partial [Pyrinomonadaceae bacterium]|nr:TonB-dependent receptor [Pyrinomonadaceae bacterium]